MTRHPRLGAILFLLPLAGCSNVQSALSPIGAEAERINLLFWIMTIGGTLIFVGVLALAAIAIWGTPPWRARLSRENLITGLGLVFPVILLTILLTYGLFVLHAGAVTVPADGMRIAISGERWWWRVTYFDDAGNTITTANELHVPVGEPVVLELTSPDVIHSFWAPRFAGKLDMIPGRTNILTLTATEAGISRGQCAEYCGGAHAFMAFHVVAQSPEDFAAWLANEASPAQEPQTAAEQRGARLFQLSGCGACHTVRGTAAAGVVGPDLTHVGARMSIAAATLPNTAEAFARWIENNQHIKPENLMPPYDIFSEAELQDLALYLESLK
jgi:cytochrome c oxidase subunit 2